MKIKTFDIVVFSIMASVALTIIISAKVKPKPKPVTEHTFTNAIEVAVNKLPSIYDDFVMGSVTAVSNATAAATPAPGWSIVCSSDGHYAPMTSDGRIMDRSPYMIRTNRFHAIVATWRYKEIWDSTTPEYQPHKYGAAKDWKPCDN